MILAWLLLLTGLTISAVAIYYSVVGLAAIFSAAVIPIIVMGSALEVAKLVCASWLKANWNQAPRLMKVYMTTAVIVLMLVTSMGIFGFLSKAHSDQSLVSGDVLSKISIYDEKIKTAKDNIDANRKALKQMDESVDQSMARSNDEKGADKAVALRRSQAKERARLQSEIAAEQKAISSLNEQAAPIRAEVRKVEAEVGPLKYIAAFVYGATDETILEKAVTWVIITIIVVFDPLAVIMLLAAQMTFGWKKEEDDKYLLHDTVPADTTKLAEGDSPAGSSELQTLEQPTVTNLTPVDIDQVNHELALAAEAANDPTLPFATYEEITPTPEPQPEPAPRRGLMLSDILGDNKPGPAQPNSTSTLLSDIETFPATDLDAWNKMIEEAERAVEEEKKFATGEIQDLPIETVAKLEDKLATTSFEEGIEFPTNPVKGQRFKNISDPKDHRNYIYNGSAWADADRSNIDALKPLLDAEEELKKKSYMTKDEEGRIVTKNRP